MFNLTTKPVSAGELMKKEKKPINFVVEKFISQGVHFLAGHPKSGNMYDAPNMDNGFDVFLKKIVKEEPEIKLVIVDTFQLIRGEQFAGNAYACEYAEMNYLKKLAKELMVY